VPWHRVLEYERMLAEARIARDVPERPDVDEAATVAATAAEREGTDRDHDDGRVADVAAAERDDERELPAAPNAGIPNGRGTA
jgi:hypothetical protein